MEASRFIVAATLFILAGSVHTPPNTDRGCFLGKGRERGGRRRESYCISPRAPPPPHGSNLHERAYAGGAAWSAAGDRGPCAGITIQEA